MLQVAAGGQNRQLEVTGAWRTLVVPSMAPFLSEEECAEC